VIVAAEPDKREMAVAEVLSQIVAAHVPVQRWPRCSECNALLLVDELGRECPNPSCGVAT
jgi:hypothetical protein